jgi:hypothetical protein
MWFSHHHGMILVRDFIINIQQGNMKQSWRKHSQNLTDKKSHFKKKVRYYSLVLDLTCPDHLIFLNLQSDNL